MTKRRLTDDGELKSMPDDTVTVYFCECGRMSLEPIAYSHVNMGKVHRGSVCVNGEKTMGIYDLHLWKEMPSA